MIIELIDGKLTATAETVNDVRKIMELEKNAPVLTYTKGIGEVSTRKPHKRHNFKKSCNVCGKELKGVMGLGIHLSRAHGIFGRIKQKNMEKEANAYKIHGLSASQVIPQ